MPCRLAFTFVGDPDGQLLAFADRLGDAPIKHLKNNDITTHLAWRLLFGMETYWRRGMNPDNNLFLFYTRLPTYDEIEATRDKYCAKAIELYTYNDEPIRHAIVMNDVDMISIMVIWAWEKK